MSNEVRAPALAGDTGSTPAPQRWLPGEQQMIWTIWLTYGAFYFCRTNISAAVHGLGLPVAEGGAGLTGGQIATILGSLKLAYGIGQLVNGQLSERVSPRVLLAIGMLCSAALSVAFGLGTGFYYLLFVWAVNGYIQSLGWTPCIRVLKQWVPITRRGHALGIVGTGYQVTLALTFFVSSQSAALFGWRGALLVPPVLLVAAALVMLLFLRESPDAVENGDDLPAATTPRLPAAEVLTLTLSNPALWYLGLSLAMLNACRFGFVDWGISHLIEVQQIGVSKAGLQYVVLGIGAVAGSYLAGWATDRFFGGRRAPVLVGLLVLLGLLCIAYEAVSRYSGVATVSLLVVIGFCVFGPQVLLVGTAPTDLARRGTAAAAAGFVDCLGYMGGAAGDLLTGTVKGASWGGWQVAIYFWAAWAFLSAVFAALLWNASAHSHADQP